MRSLIASPLGFLVGLSLGALGGGGSILAVPALVYGVGESAQGATATSLLVVGVAALIGVVPHWRRGNVRLAAGLLFGVAGLGGSVVGTWLNGGVEGDVLLLAFSVFMVVAGVAMVLRTRRSTESAEPCEEDLEAADLEAAAGVDVALPRHPGAPGHRAPDAPGGSPNDSESASAGSARTGADATGADTTGSDTMGSDTMVTAPVATQIHLDARTAVKVVVAGTIVGTLTGFFGVGGGFVIVPALVLSLGFAMPEAVGTSLVVIAVNAAMALALRAGSNEIDWAAALPFLVTAVAGTIVGGRLADRVDPTKLTYAFVALLAVIATFTGVSAVIAITS